MSTEVKTTAIEPQHWWPAYAESNAMRFKAEQSYLDISSAIADVYEYHKSNLGHTIGLTPGVSSVPKCHPIYQKYSIEQMIAGSFRMTPRNADKQNYCNVSQVLINDYVKRELASRGITEG